MGRLSIVAVLFMIAALALAGCTEDESPEDMARDDGKAFGEAVRAVFDVDSVAELREALLAVDEAEVALVANFGPAERAQVEEIVDGVNAILDDLRAAIDADSDEVAREAARSALSEIPSLAVSIAAITSDDSLVKAAVEGFIDGLGL